VSHTADGVLTHQHRFQQAGDAHAVPARKVRMGTKPRRACVCCTRRSGHSQFCASALEARRGKTNRSRLYGHQTASGRCVQDDPA
jgi:hypothetical protein